MLTIDTIPLCLCNRKTVTGDGKFLSPVTSHPLLLILFMHPVAAAATAELFHLKPVRRVLLVLGRRVVTLFALGALQNYVISWHKSSCSECKL